MARVPALPQNTELTYLAEGAANIVYRISIRPLTPEPTLLEQYGTGTPPPTEIEPEDEIEYLNEQPLFNCKSRHVTLHLQPYSCAPLPYSDHYIS